MSGDIKRLLEEIFNSDDNPGTHEQSENDSED
jgi:hypothetical protein